MAIKLKENEKNKKSRDYLKFEKNAQTTPSKTTMNFVHHQSMLDIKKLAPLLAFLVFALLMFAKFGFIDPLNEKSAALNELNSRQVQLEAVNARLAEIADLEREYERYSFKLMSEKETGLVDSLEVMKLMEKKIMLTASVKDFSISSNVFSTNINGLSLEKASRIVQYLESSDIVKNATVYSANAPDGSEASIYMSVNLTKEAED